MGYSKTLSRFTTKSILIMLLLFGLISCESPQSSETEISTKPTDTGTAPTVTPPPTALPTINIGSWVIADYIPRGLVDTPNELQFVSNVELKRIDTKGAELIVTMNPVVDSSCTQKFLVGWEFEHDIDMVVEGETFNVTVFNQPSGSLAECYVNAKNEMAYGGEVTIELKPSGSSHFLSLDNYKRYHEGYSQYLFVLTTPTGAVYPAGPISPTRSAVGTILVKDGIYEIGEIDAPHGNFSFTISAGNVFAYTATYLYDAVKLP